MNLLCTLSADLVWCLVDFFWIGPKADKNLAFFIVFVFLLFRLLKLDAWESRPISTLRLPKQRQSDAKHLMNIAHFPIPVDGTIKAIRRLPGGWAFGSHVGVLTKFIVNTCKFIHHTSKEKKGWKNRWHYIELTIIGEWWFKCQMFLPPYIW